MGGNGRGAGLKRGKCCRGRCRRELKGKENWSHEDNYDKEIIVKLKIQF